MKLNKRREGSAGFRIDTWIAVRFGNVAWAHIFPVVKEVENIYKYEANLQQDASRLPLSQRVILWEVDVYSNVQANDKMIINKCDALLFSGLFLLLPWSCDITVMEAVIENGLRKDFAIYRFQL